MAGESDEGGDASSAPDPDPDGVVAEVLGDVVVLGDVGVVTTGGASPSIGATPP